MNGLLRCARYGFSPNKLKYCGPDKNQQLLSYVTEKAEDRGLEELLAEFRVMYPYLSLIARENKIADPFAEKVVEAYWLGNELLEHVSLKQFYDHLLEDQGLGQRFKAKDLKWIIGKVPLGAKPHHSFHVFNIWNRTGHEARPHTVETMDQCRISWGKLVKGLGPETENLKLVVETQRLIYKEGKLAFENGVLKEINWRLGDKRLAEGLKPGDWVTFHWNWLCEKVSLNQVKNLEKYTNWHLCLANLTI
jgi:hypothetical protein